MSAPWAWRRRSQRLARRLPLATAGAVLGDLHEEYRQRLGRDGRVRAEWWLSWQMRSVTAAYARYESAGPSWRSRLRADELSRTVRSLARAPWYASTAVGVMALGTALGTSVFAIVDGTLFKPLPYQHSSRLFAVALGHSQLPEPLASLRPVSPVVVAEWRAAAPEIAFTAFYIGGLQTVGHQDSVRSADVDVSFFDVLGVRPLVGGFSPEDFGSPTSVRPAIVTARFWRERFGAAEPALGQVLTDRAGEGIRIVGVLPDTFVFPSASRASFTPQLLTPLFRDPTDRGDSLRVLARLRPDADVRLAAERMNAIVAAQAATAPRREIPANLSPRARILRGPYDRAGLESVDSALRSTIGKRAWVVFSAAALLVLLACFNVAGLAIARARERQRDLVVRCALGAGTRDLVRLLALENALIVTTGTAAGLLLAWWSLPLGARLFAGDFMLTLKPAAIDLRVAAFAALVAAAGSAMVILLSARTVARVQLRRPLAEETGGTTPRVRKRLSLVSFEIAVAYLVTVTAALVVGSLLRVWSEDTGFDVPDMAIVRMGVPPNSTASDIDRLLADVTKLPGVQSAGGVAHLVLEQGFNGSVFASPPGYKQQDAAPGSSFPIESVPVTAGFFAAAGLVPRDGRLPSEDEYRRGAPLIVVTETVAREYWPGQRAVGQVLFTDGRPFDVIGVVNDLRFLSLDLPAQGEIFWPVAAMPEPRLSNVVLKLTPDGRTDVDQVATTVRQQCPDCWVRASLTLEEALAEGIRPRRFSAWLFTGFGLAALVIVGTGILGVVAMTTARRVREIGIRMALGATARNVVSALVREQLASVLIGIGMGGLAAWWTATLLTSYLYETEPTDSVAWLAAAGAILMVALLGAVVPARRATRIDPVRALRVE